MKKEENESDLLGFSTAPLSWILIRRSLVDMAENIVVKT